MKPVASVGSINIDLVSYLDRWPTPGETIAVRETRSSLGGKGANQAVAAARLGADVTLVGAVGSDSFALDAREQLNRSCVQSRLSEIPNGSTGLAFIDVGPDGNNLIRLSGGANLSVSAAHVALHAEVIRNCGVLLLQNEIGLPASLEAARTARAAGGLVIMDPAPAPDPAWKPDVFRAFDILTPNAHEAGTLLGKVPATLEDGEKAAGSLRNFGLRGAIVTMGDIGVAWSFDDDQGSLPAPKVESIDTVAAGDCFNGALATGLAEGETMRDAIAFALRAAAIATTRKGASLSLPTRAELDNPQNPVFALS
ncbi:ribokinase [Roseibium sp. MMSF_3412]|uniref:ribokinase n=1 Tax=Roseibium sp. MMSF_3412 TaxID=3046712 RepID=UPI00273E5A75|nr:ribokinase [Roseibium sp. MMSF_3412]